MEAKIQTLLTELENAGREHDLHEQVHSQKVLNLEPETALVLHLLLRSSRRKRILEIGTSNGYSTIWLADAIRDQEGHITSIDRSEHKHQLADANLRKAELRASVKLVHGDATEIVSRLTGPFDCVFFDADRYSAPAQLAILMPKLEPDVLLLADNARSHPTEIASYLQAIAALPEFEHTVIPVGKGLSVAYRQSKG